VLLSLFQFIFAVLAIAILLRSTRRVRVGHVHLVERLGRYHRTLDPGLHMLVPFIDQVNVTIDMREGEQRIDAGPGRVAVVRYCVVDPVRAAYGTQNVIDAMEHAVQHAVRAGTLKDAELDAALRTQAPNWGLHIGSVRTETASAGMRGADGSSQPAPSARRGPFIG
jgi:regulator of protease activity HflC (stomatin/prohibitin superfamily)